MARALIRVLGAESLKLKGTIALKLAILFPVIVTLLQFFAVSQAPFSTVNMDGVHHEWTLLTLNTLGPWALVVLPLLAAIETALIAGLDHSGNQWKSLLARPIPTWTPYIVKFAVAAALAAGSTALLLCGMVLDGAILPHVQPEVVFGSPAPWAAMCRLTAQVLGVGLLALAIQHWVSMRWRSFSVAVGVGVAGTVVGLFIAAGYRHTYAWPLYFPWSLPSLVVRRQPHDPGYAVLCAVGLGLAATVAGCLDFCKRDVA